MKLIKIFGIVAGVHAVALLLIFLNPGCSSSRARSAAAAQVPAPAPQPDSAPETPAISAVPIVAAPADTPPAPAPDTTPAAPGGGAFYSPTRPGTPAASALEAQPVADVTPAAEYTVGRGDSLWSIAKKNHLKVSVLAGANHLRVGATLRPGQKLIIPGKPPRGHPASAAAPAGPAAAEAKAPAEQKPAEEASEKHVVRHGETLGTIARHYGIRMGDLATANNISDPQKIRPGQELIIPPRRSSRRSAATGSAPAAPPPPAPAPAVPGSNQDLDAGLKAAPSDQVPVIRIQPDTTQAPPAK